MEEMKEIMTSKNIFEIDFLTDRNNYYLSENSNLVYENLDGISRKDLGLYKIKEISFEEVSPRKEALENVLSSMKIDGINFIYLILGDENGVSFYYGVAKDYSYKEIMDIDIKDIGQDILEPSIKGNFRGSKTQEVDANEKDVIMKNIDDMKYYSILEGVPGYTKEDEKFQGVDRLVDVMLGDRFGFMIIAKPLNAEEIKSIENNLYDVYTKIVPFSKKSLQGSLSENTGTSEGKTTGKSDTKGESETKSTQFSSSDTKGTNKSISNTESINTSLSNTNSVNTSKSSSKGVNSSTSTTEGTNKNFSFSTSKNTSYSSSNSGSRSSTSNSSGEGKSDTKGHGSSTTEGKTRGVNESTSTTMGDSKSTSTTKGSSESKGITEGENKSKTMTEGESTSFGTSTSITTSENISEQDTKGEGKSISLSTEMVNKKSQEWLKYLDEVIIPRLDYGTGKGVFMTTSFLFAENKSSLKKLENTAISLYSGKTGNKVPLKSIPFTKNNDRKLNLLKNFQLPMGSFKEDISFDEEISRNALSQYAVNHNKFYLGNWITTNELAMIAGLPQKDVVGLELKEEVEFGLNFSNDIKDDDKIDIGNLVQSGNILKSKVSIDKKNLDKHIFITGVTGSGKTTTCQKILIDSNLPFLVIEPAKTEYRILSERYDDLIIFTLGNDTGAPFRLNPFEFFEHESITSRVDMIRASIESAFDMEAAIPQLIENAIYECYKDYGWNISSNKNEKYENSAFEDGVYAFPTLQDLIYKVDSVVGKQGFDDRLKNDYIGSIKSRLQGLLMGSKGLMLNTKRSINFKDILEKRVVLELEEIRSGSEKSLIMGFVLTNLMEAIKGRFFSKGYYSHITLVEEAHRLLSKFFPGDSPNKKNGVETFTDMLAEIRKYGESLMIVDQIPNKLTPEILKNTNTKIVHKLFAEDDKEAIGNTMVLAKEQKEFLSNLDTGRAIVFTQGFNKAVQVQVDNITNTTGNNQVDISVLRKRVYEYYADNYKKGIIEGSQYFEERPSEKDIERLFDLSRQTELFNKILSFLKCDKKLPEEDIVNKLHLFVNDPLVDDFIETCLFDYEKSSDEKETNKEKCFDTKYISFFEEVFQKCDVDFFAEFIIKKYYSKKVDSINYSNIDFQGTIIRMKNILEKYINRDIKYIDLKNMKNVLNKYTKSNLISM